MTEVVRRVKIVKPALLISKPQEHAWSGFQQAVFDNVEHGEGNTIVQAVAGSGKTTTLVKSVTYTYDDESTVVLAFGRPAAEELRREVPSGVEALTSHALGLRSIRKACGKVEVDANRTKRILKGVLSAFEMPPDYKQYGAIMQTISLAKNTAALTEDELASLMIQAGVQPDGLTQKEWERSEQLQLNIVIETLKRCEELDGTVDFDDMVWLPFIHDLPAAFRYNRVFVDEAQDLNAAQVDQVLKLARKSGRVLVVGDRAQSCYGFRGADVYAMDNLKRALKAKELPLSVCYRCGTRIVEEAARVVPQITSPPGQHAGMVIESTESEMFKRVQPGDMIVSRFNSPMVRICYKLLLAGVPAHIMGRDVGSTLSSLIKKLKADSVGDLRAKVIAWGDKELERIKQHRLGEGIADSVRDKRMCVLALCDSASSMGELEERLGKLFTDVDKSKSVTLSSTHRAKGLERNTIWLLRSTYPYIWHGDAAGQQEKNLYYIGLTRAIERLHLVDMDRPFRSFDE